MVEVRLGTLNKHVQHLFAICQQILLNSGFRENDRLTARNPLPERKWTSQITCNSENYNCVGISGGLSEREREFFIYT